VSEPLVDSPLSAPDLPVPLTSSRPLAVFDIDGVLADVRHRLHHLEARPQRWERFFRSADRDPLLVEGAERLRAALADHDVVYVTGRPESTRSLTERWLARHGLPTGPLVMREDDDDRPARYLKRDVLRRLSEHRQIASVLDDDPAVVRMLAEDGWPIELATWLPHSSTLRSAQERRGRT
jgi:phosphoglycolate phosphatase-like HAD superfamily hydrolase